MTQAIFLFVVVLVVVGYCAGVACSKKNLAQRFIARPEMSIDEFYRQFYQSSGIEKQRIEELLNMLLVNSLCRPPNYGLAIGLTAGWRRTKGGIGIQVTPL